MERSELTLNVFNLAYLRRLLADIDEGELDLQPHPEVHSVRWILAHLAIAADYGLQQLGQPPACPAAWHAAYGPTSPPGTSSRSVPSQSELMAAIDNGYQRLRDGLSAADPEKLREPHEVELLKDTPLTSKADIVAHILATHMATHLGQLSVWRRLTGRVPLF